MFPFEIHVPKKLIEMGKTPKNQKDVVDFFVTNEGPGIINWLLAGLQKYYQLGYIPFCEKVTTATEQMLLENDLMGRCIRDIAMKIDGEYVNKDAWFIAVNNWCTDNDEEPFPTKRDLSRAMVDRGFGLDDRRGGNRVWLGIRLKKKDELDSGIRQL